MSEGTRKMIDPGEQLGSCSPGRNEKEGTFMDLRDIKYHSCPIDDEDGTLVVDFETESMPEMDEDGNYLYYCNSGHTFTVDDEDSNYYSSWRR